MQVSYIYLPSSTQFFNVSPRKSFIVETAKTSLHLILELYSICIYVSLIIVKDAYHAGS